jgi:hypothetical protein
MIKNLLIKLIKTYQKLLAPLMLPCCRFYPSCSNYAIQSLEKYGVIKGSLLAAIRLFKCNPFHPGGLDPLK